jgi:hypothetical protein
MSFEDGLSNGARLAFAAVADQRTGVQGQARGRDRRMEAAAKRRRSPDRMFSTQKAREKLRKAYPVKES